MPVLPATSTPESAAAVPVPSRTTFFIIAVRSLAVLADTTRCSSSGSTSSTVRPSGSTALAMICGLRRTPPLPIVCATVAIWSGVAKRSPWPIATRPTSTRSDVIGTSRPPLRTPEADICASG